MVRRLYWLSPKDYNTGDKRKLTPKEGDHKNITESYGGTRFITL